VSVDVRAGEIYCSSCGNAFVPGRGPVTVFVQGVPACPECGGASFIPAVCQWCQTVFLWVLGGGDACPACSHNPYWDT